MTTARSKGQNEVALPSAFGLLGSSLKPIVSSIALTENLPPRSLRQAARSARIFFYKLDYMAFNAGGRAC
jgi:hypothetical protein